MKKRILLMALGFAVLIFAESGCNEVLGLSDACLSCGGAVNLCTANQCPDDDDLCESQTESWQALKACICKTCFTCGDLCGDAELGDGCAKCIKEQVEGPTAPCKIENASCRF